MPIVLACHRGIGPDVTGAGAGREGQFLRPLRSRPHLAGIFSRPAHKLAGQSYVGSILVLDTAKGGVASAWMLREMAERGSRRWRSSSTGPTRSWRRAPRSPT